MIAFLDKRIISCYKSLGFIATYEVPTNETQFRYTEVTGRPPNHSNFQVHDQCLYIPSIRKQRV